jgi:quercetin 2,3-dioxygenase
VTHSEFNASKSELVHFLQIWLLPEQKNIKPSYEQKTFAVDETKRKLRLVGSQDGRDGSVTIHQDVDLYATRLEAGEAVRHELKPGRHAWVHLARGKAKINGNELEAGGAVALSNEARVDLEGVSPAEVLLFDLG